MRSRLRPLISKRRVVVVAVILLAVGVGTSAWAATRSPAAAAYQLVAASPGTIRQTVAATGVLQPARQANLSFAVSGQVTAVNVAVGDQVSAAQSLASLHAPSLATQVAQSQATVATDQARLTADQTAAASGAQVNADQAALTAAQSALANAQQAQSDATLTSPIAGTVAALNLTVGQQVAGGGTPSGSAGTGATGNSGGATTGAAGAGGTTTGSTTAASGSTTAANAQVVVIGTDAFTVAASVDDTQVGQIKTGDQAEITPDGSTSVVYGTVASVGMLATQTSGVATYAVSIAVTGSPPGLYAGASAQVSIIVRQLTSALTVPSAALHASGSGVVVYEVANGHQVSRPVTVGLSSGGQTQINSGLVDGAMVEVPTTRTPANGSGRSSGGTGGFGTGGGGLGGGLGGGTGRTGGGGFGGGGLGGGGGRTGG